MRPLNELKFCWQDYVVFATSLTVPLAIGTFFFFYKRRQQSTDSFLVGDRSLNVVAVGMSLIASLLNGIFIIGLPAEMHYHGTEMTYMLIAAIVVTVLGAHVFIPRYRHMRSTSAYEYIEKRFNYTTRAFASAMFCTSMIVFLAVVLYVPALAFAQVTHMHLYVTIVVTGSICTVYTTIGGIKAVVWADAVQMLILLVGLIILAVVGCVRVGGGAAVWRIALDTGRINHSDFSVDPRVRHTFWTQTLGYSAVYLAVLSCNQMMIQRYMSVSSTRRAQAASYISLLTYVPILVLVTIIGLAMHARYVHCDPLVSRTISSGDQILPYYLLDVMGEYRGAPGIILAAVFAAALSSVSSVINSLAAVCLEDFICPGVFHFKGVKLCDRARRRTAIVLVFLFGALTIGLSFTATYFTSILIQTAATVWGVLGSPLGGIFIMGFFMPFCNSAGAISGMIGGLFITLWISVGRMLYAPPTRTLEVGTCQGNITVSLPPPNHNQTDYISSPLMELYNVSYAWYGMIGIASSVLIGALVSALTGGCKRSFKTGPDDVGLNEHQIGLVDVSYETSA